MKEEVSKGKKSFRKKGFELTGDADSKPFIPDDDPDSVDTMAYQSLSDSTQYELAKPRWLRPVINASRLAFQHGCVAKLSAKVFDDFEADSGVKRKDAKNTALPDPETKRRKVNARIPTGKRRRIPPVALRSSRASSARQFSKPPTKHPRRDDGAKTTSVRAMHIKPSRDAGAARSAGSARPGKC